MKYEHTREYLVPVVVEVTYEDLRTIQKMTKYFLDLETLPDNMWKGDIRRLDRGTNDALEHANRSIAYTFPKPADND